MIHVDKYAYFSYSLSISKLKLYLYFEYNMDHTITINQFDSRINHHNNMTLYL